MKTVLTRMAALLLAMGLQAAGVATAAQDYPNQPVRMIVPYPPGGSTDFIARLYAEGLGNELGQPVVVDNRPGAATNIGSDAVAKAKPDGYTVLFGAGTPVMNSVFGPKPPFDPLHALDSVSLIARVSFMVAANPRVAFNSPQDLIASAKAAPGKLAIASAQLSTYVELLKLRANVNLLHIPYKGGAQAATDAIAGQVDMVYALVPVLLPHVQAGKLKAIAVTSSKRLDKLLPHVATFTEAGVDYDISTAFGLQVPAGTPPAVIERLKKATHNVVIQASFVDKLTTVGVEAVYSEPAEMRSMLSSQLAVWQKLAVTTPALRATESK